MFIITGLPAFKDNYIWMLEHSESQTCYVVDPGDARVVLQACRDKRLTLAGILITHHHYDHVGGVRALTNNCDIPVYGPSGENIAEVTHALRGGDTITVYGSAWQIIETPGHTAGHICYFAEPAHRAPVLFCGDTLFAGGCGRLLEGTAAQMLDSLTRLSALPEQTEVYCAHEYTRENLAFARTVEPGNTALEARISTVTQLREQGLPTVPSTVALELRTNPFLRTDIQEVKDAASRYCGQIAKDSEAVFTIIRQRKDKF